MAQFGTGDKNTLAGDNRPDLLSFYKKYYAASNMKLAMISNAPLEILVAKAQKYFSSIENRPVKVPEISSEFRKPLKNEYRLLTIKTIKDE